MLEVCPGTQNGLSSTGSQENQYNLIRNRYYGCEIVMGNLEITQIESNWDFSFLKVNVMFPYSPGLQSVNLNSALKSGEYIVEVASYIASYINGLLHSRESVR